jgi:hypothetical protein
MHLFQVWGITSLFRSLVITLGVISMVRFSGLLAYTFNRVFNHRHKKEQLEKVFALF